MTVWFVFINKFMRAAERHLETYALDVLGCKVNRYDSRQIARLLEGFGLRATVRGETADIIIVHTCGVTATAVQKCRQTVSRLIRKHAGAALFLTGCAATEELIDSPEKIDSRIAAGPGWIQLLADELQKFSLPNSDFHLPENSDELPAETYGEQTRAFLKIQDGCDANCAYCIVPQLRKTPRDKTPAAIIDEAEALVKRGCREIVVAGVHVGLYGRTAGVPLAGILKQLAAVPELRRIRMSSLHPAELTDDLLNVWSASSNIMPHLHLSLQSGAAGVLRRMGRGYTPGEYAAAVNRARAALDNPSITTDIIVGFPGETDEEFEETFRFCEQIGFAGIHIFVFSPRPGTRAALMPEKVAPPVAHERQRRLAGLAAKMTETYNQTFIGKTVDVLVERAAGGNCTGGTPHHITVQFAGSKNLHRTIVPVTILSATAQGLTGTRKDKM